MSHSMNGSCASSTLATIDILPPVAVAEIIFPCICLSPRVTRLVPDYRGGASTSNRDKSSPIGDLQEVPGHLVCAA